VVSVADPVGAGVEVLNTSSLSYGPTHSNESQTRPGSVSLRVIGSVSVSSSMSRHATFRNCAGSWNVRAVSGIPEAAFAFARPRLSAAADPVAAFDCGVEALNRYLQKHALQTQRGEGARTYVSLCEDLLAGYYTLAYGSVENRRRRRRV